MSTKIKRGSRRNEWNVQSLALEVRECVTPADLSALEGAQVIVTIQGCGLKPITTIATLVGVGPLKSIKPGYFWMNTEESESEDAEPEEVKSDDETSDGE